MNDVPSLLALQRIGICLTPEKVAECEALVRQGFVKQALEILRDYIKTELEKK